jgi:tetratricopeptide (TPR) repeat protein
MLRAFDANPTDRILCDALVARYRARGDIVTVATVLDRAVRAFPADLELALRLAAAYREAGQFEDGLAVIEGLYASGIETIELNRERGRALSALGRHEDALASLEAGDPSQPEGAEALLSGIRAATPTAPESWLLQLGLREVGLLEQLNRLDEAREVLDALDNRYPSHLTVLSAKAKLAASSGDAEGAVDAYLGLAEVVEGDELIGLVLDLSDACEKLGTPERAQTALERAVSVAPTNDQLRQKLCSVYRLLGANRELAGLLIDEARQIEDVTLRQARLLEIAELLSGADGDPVRAESVLMEARELGPDNLEVSILLARAVAKSGRSEAALELLNESVQSQRNRRSKPLSRVYYEISRIQLDEGFLTDAFESLQRATEIDIRNGGMAMELGRLALEIDERDVAMKTFGRVAMMKLVDTETGDGSTDGVSRADRADANYRLGKFAKEAGDIRKARMLFQKVLSDNAAHEEAKAALIECG